MLRGERGPNNPCGPWGGTRRGLAVAGGGVGWKAGFAIVKDTLVPYFEDMIQMNNLRCHVAQLCCLSWGAGS